MAKVCLELGVFHISIADPVGSAPQNNFIIIINDSFYP